MAVSREASGTELIQDTDGVVTPTGATITTTGGFQLLLDLNDLDDGELVIVRISKPVLNTGTRRVVEIAHYANQLGEVKIVESDVHTNIAGDTNDLSFTLETEGVTTDVSIPWAWIDYGGAP